MTFNKGDRAKSCCVITRRDYQISDVIKVKNISYSQRIYTEFTTKHDDINDIWVNTEYDTHDYQYIRQRKLNNLLR